MKVTLQDIAQETGYSISTVSRVLSGSDKISSKARRKIYQSATDMGYPVYTKLDGGKILEAAKINFIITGFHSGEFYASFFHGIDQAVKKQNIRLSLTSIQKSFEDFLLTVKELSEQKVDGIILYTPTFTRKEYEAIRDILPENYPVISNHFIENPVFTTVIFDIYSGGYLAAEHFHERGYTCCGLIEGPFKKAGSRNRANGFKDFIRQNNEMEVVWEFRGDLSFESGKEAFENFLESSEKPRAIFSSNDVMCHAFMQEAREKGYTFPEDIAIVGYDDLPICVRHKPTISSIHTDYEQLGIVTMEKMKELLTNPRQEQGIISFVPVSLVARESS